MRLSFADETNEEIARGREYTPFPRQSWRVVRPAEEPIFAFREIGSRAVWWR
jgi:hypothetical protein